ncbi:MAG: hypothetical protein Q9172_001714, partial [Xanthocarpia lactea]
MPQSTKSTFLNTPLDIRRSLYQMVLPRRDKPMNTQQWGTITGIPNRSMGLLRVNKQISAEAQDYIYGCNSFTLTVSQESIYFHGNPRQALMDHRPFLTTPSIKYMKNWQIDIQFNPSYHSEWYGGTMLAPHLGSQLANDQYYIREGILSASVEMAKAKELQTLKVRFPCLCRMAKKTRSLVRGVRKAVASSLEPLQQQLRFKSSVNFIATSSSPATSLPWASPCFRQHIWARPHLMQLIREVGYVQCQEADCLKFVKSFEYLGRMLTSKILPPSRLTLQQQKWLDLKAYASRLLPGRPKSTQRLVLYQAWCFLEKGEVAFEAKYRLAQRWIEKKWEERRSKRAASRRTTDDGAWDPQQQAPWMTGNYK